MKKNYLLLGFLLFAAGAFSQENKKITYGLHAGINLSQFTDKEKDVSVSSSSKVGFTGGVDVEFHLSPSVTIQPELNFSQMGGRLPNQTGVTQDSTSVLIKNSVIENYLSLPVLIKYTIPNTGIGLYVGPQYSYLLNAKSHYDYKQLSTSSNVTITKYYQRSDFSAILGAEYYLDCGVGLSARYQLGFINTAKVVDDVSETLKNHDFTFTVGYRF